MARLFRLWGKKRGKRRTGSPLVGSLGEALLFVSLFAVGAASLAAVLTTVVLQPAEEAGSWGLGFWLTLLVLGSFVLLAGGGFIMSLLTMSTSVEHRSALARQAADIDIISDSLPTVREYPTVPRDSHLTNSPGITFSYRLPVARSPVWHLAAAAGLSLLWNGMTIVLAVVTFERIAARGFSGNLFLLLATAAFVFVGVWATRYFLRELMQFMTVGPTILEISDHPLHAGQNYEIFLTQAGQLQLKLFQVLLTCDEEATYHPGTDVRNEVRRVSEYELYREEAVQIAPGKPFSHQGRLVMPRGVMHSFQAEHNAVKWRLVICGRTTAGRTFERAFPVVVYPQAVNGGV